LSRAMEKLLMLKIGGVIVIIFFAKGDFAGFSIQKYERIKDVRFHTCD
jgi:hypothetical protein